MADKKARDQKRKDFLTATTNTAVMENKLVSKIENLKKEVEDVGKRRRRAPRSRRPRKRPTAAPAQGPKTQVQAMQPKFVSANHKMMSNALAYVASQKAPWEATGAMIPTAEPSPLATAPCTSIMNIPQVGTNAMIVVHPNLFTSIFTLSAGTPTTPVTWAVTNVDEYDEVLAKGLSYQVVSFGCNFMATGVLQSASGIFHGAILDSELVMDPATGVPFTATNKLRQAVLESPGHRQLTIAEMMTGVDVYADCMKRPASKLKSTGTSTLYTAQMNRETPRAPNVPMTDAVYQQNVIRDYVIVWFAEELQTVAGIKGQIYHNIQFEPLVTESTSIKVQSMVSSEHCVGLIVEATGGEGETEKRKYWIVRGKSSSDNKGWLADTWNSVKDALPGLLSKAGGAIFNEFKGKLPLVGTFLQRSKHLIARAKGQVSKSPFHLSKEHLEKVDKMTLDEYSYYIDHLELGLPYDSRFVRAHADTDDLVAIMEKVNFQDVDEKGVPIGMLQTGEIVREYISNSKIEPLPGKGYRVEDFDQSSDSTPIPKTQARPKLEIPRVRL